MNILKHIEHIFKRGEMNMLGLDMKKDDSKKMEICKVWKAVANNCKMVTVPQRSDIKEGDYVRLEVMK